MTTDAQTPTPILTFKPVLTFTPMQELAKSFDPKAIEAKWYAFWEQKGYYAAGLNPVERFITGDKPVPFALSLSKGSGASAISARMVMEVN